MKKSNSASRLHSLSRLRSFSLGAATVAAGLALCPGISRADESGISFWLPGLYGSLSATPTTPGWSMGAIYYHTSVDASGAAAAAREIQVGRFSPTINVNLNISLSGQADLLFLAPTYTFATPVLGGQLSATVASIFGRNAASLAGTLTGPLGNTFSGTLQDSLTSYGDLYPTLKLKWNQGVNNYMVYAAGDIPVGDYNSMRLANLGIGHGAIDFHFDWGTSHFMSKQLFVGFVGYAYQQITDDFGQNPVLGGFRSRVLGLGPQIGYIFPIGENQAFLGLKGYREFAAENRPSGWNTWLTFSISEAAPTSTVTPTKHLVTK
jgi:hypothetical protein